MKLAKIISSALVLTVILSAFTVIPAMASEVPADKYTYTVSDKTGVQSEKLDIEESDGSKAFLEALAKENNEIVLVKDGAEIKFTPKQDMSASIRYYTIDGEYGGNLFWTIDGQEKENVEVGKTASAKLMKRYGGYTCDLYYVFSFGDANNATTTIYKVTDGAAAPAAEPAPAATPAKSVTAAASASKVLVNGKQVSFEAYNIGGSNYFKLRDIAMAVNGTAKNFEVGWDKENNAIKLIPGTAYTTAGGELVVSANPAAKQAALSTAKVYLNDSEVQLTAYNIGGNNYFKLRDVGQALGMTITWDAQTSTIGIDTSSQN